MIMTLIDLKLHTCTTQGPLHLAGKYLYFCLYQDCEFLIELVRYECSLMYRRAECACNPVRLFTILSMQRSGSGWFETLLNSHTNVSSNGEIFSIKERRSNVSSILSTLDRVYNLDLFTSASKNQCSAAVGFKWMLNQVFLPGAIMCIPYYILSNAHLINFRILWHPPTL